MNFEHLFSCSYFCSSSPFKINHLDVLFLRGDDALPHEEAEVLEELAVLLRLLLALVQQEADDPLLQNVAELPEVRRRQRRN